MKLEGLLIAGKSPFQISEKALRQVRTTVTRLLKEGMDPEKAEQLATKLSSGNWTHDYPISVGDIYP